MKRLPSVLTICGLLVANGSASLGDWTIIDLHELAVPHVSSLAVGISDSPYGTYDQGGNVWEWNEAIIGENRGVRGGAIFSYTGTPWDNLHASPRYHFTATFEYHSWGFRVAHVPEPSTLVLLGIGALSLLAYAWRKRRC